MFYIIGLFVTIAALIMFATNSPILADFGPSNLFSNAWLSLKDKSSDLFFPKSKNEILIDNLDTNYDLLDRFFSEDESSALNNILKSNVISLDDKKALIEAATAFNNSKEIVGELETSRGSSIIKSIAKKIFNLEDDTPSPTDIPPQCSLICNNE